MSLRTMHENNKKNIIKPSEPIQSPSTNELLSLIQETVIKESGTILDQSEAISGELRFDRDDTRTTLRRADTKVKSSTSELIEKLNGSNLELNKAEELQNSLKEKEKHWKNEVERS